MRLNGKAFFSSFLKRVFVLVFDNLKVLRRCVLKYTTVYRFPNKKNQGLIQFFVCSMTNSSISSGILTNVVSINPLNSTV